MSAVPVTGIHHIKVNTPVLLGLPAGYMHQIAWCLLQAGQQAASSAIDSDSDDGDDYEQYSDLDAFDADDIEVSPDDEQALAAFMVSTAFANMPSCLQPTLFHCSCTAGKERESPALAPVPSCHRYAHDVLCLLECNADVWL